MKDMHICQEQLNRVVLDKDRVILKNKDGVPLAALVPIEDFRYLVELEKHQDQEALLKAKEELERGEYVTIDELLSGNGMNSSIR